MPLFRVLFMLHCTSGKCSSHVFSGEPTDLAVKASIITLLYCSTCPLALGVATALRICFMLLSCMNLLKDALVNEVPRSEINLLGTPNMPKYSDRALMELCDFVLLTGFKYTYRVKASTMTNIYIYICYPFCCEQKDQRGRYGLYQKDCQPSQ